MCRSYPLYSKKEDPKVRRIVAAVNQRFDWQLKIKHRHCLIPATGFHEWDAEKNRHLFHADQLLYLAGIHHSFMGSNKFVILTKQPNEAVEAVHNRMPVLILPAQSKKWFDDLTAAVERKNDMVP